jgi:RHS repeat-associated protein
LPGVFNTGVISRKEITRWRERSVSIGAADARGEGLGGWSFAVHHQYDPFSKALYLGNGEAREAESLNFDLIDTFAGTGSVQGALGDGGPATEARILTPRGLAVAADGSVYIAEWGNPRIRKVSPDGVITTVAGTGVRGYSGDGGPGVAAQLNLPEGLAVGPDGSLYIADHDNHRIRRLAPNGIIDTVAGKGPKFSRGGVGEFSGDGGLATEAGLNFPSSVAVSADGTLYIADTENNRIRRVTSDGIITTVAGGGTPLGNGIGDDGPATQARLLLPASVALGTDGSLYIADGNHFRIRRVTPDGTITTVAGNGISGGFVTEGRVATTTNIFSCNGLAVAPDDSFCLGCPVSERIRRVGADGIINTFVGSAPIVNASYAGDFAGDGGPAAAARLNRAEAVAIGRDGSVYIADVVNNRIRRVASSLPAADAAGVLIASEDGGEVYQFDSAGRHLRTLHSLTGGTLYEFGYDAAGRLISVTDGSGNVTSIEHDAGGNPTAIVAPFGQRTNLSVDANGYLARITNPADESVQGLYTPDGLLTSFTDPMENTARMTYDGEGRLVRDVDRAGGFWAFERTAAQNGFTVTKSSALGRRTAYLVEDNPNGDERRLNTFPDGVSSELTIGKDGKRAATFADGTLLNVEKGPDPRFHMQAPLTARLTLTSGGFKASQMVARTVEPASTGTPFGFRTISDTLTLNGRVSTRVYDSASRTLTLTSPDGRRTTTILDSLGRATQVEAPGLLSVHLTYDGRGLVASIGQGTGSEARSWTFTYNSRGEMSGVIDPVGRTSGFQYDLAGRLTSQTLPDKSSLTYKYDANGNVKSLTPPGRPAHKFTYTGTDYVESYTPPAIPDGGSTDYTYNTDRQLQQVLRPDGQRLDLVYDQAGRLGTVTFSPRTVMYGYDRSTGKLSELSSSSGGTLDYDYNGALLTRSAWTGEVAGQVGFEYDNDFRLTSLMVNGTEPLAMEYSAGGFLVRAGNLTITRKNSQNGLITETALGAVNDRFGYNGFGEVIEYSANYQGTEVFGQKYSYDKLGRITEKVETAGAARNAFEYVYDTAGHLQQVKKNGVLAASYTYDANGNRLSGPELIETAAYDDQDRLLRYGEFTYAYTSNGELVSKTTGSSVTGYDYDVLGNLRRVALPERRIIEYLIDGQNRRIGKKINGVLVQGFLYQSGLTPIAELDRNNNVVSRFVYGTRSNVPEYMIKGGATYRILTDLIGSPRLIVNASTGAIVQRLDYGEFGEVLADTNPGFQPFGFAGGLYDRDTKLVRFGARDYHPEIGRWTLKDPIGLLPNGTNAFYMPTMIRSTESIHRG